MEELKLATLEQSKALLDGTSKVISGFQGGSKSFYRAGVQAVWLRPSREIRQGRVMRYIEHMTGLSHQQVTRLVRRYRKDGKLSKQPCTPEQGFI